MTKLGKKRLDDSFCPDRGGCYYNRKLQKRTLKFSTLGKAFVCKETGLYYIGTGLVVAGCFDPEDLIGRWDDELEQQSSKSDIEDPTEDLEEEWDEILD